MKLITFKDIENLKISPNKCYEWVKNTIKNKNKAILPSKISMRPYPEIFCNVMPCMIDSNIGNYAGLKVVTRYPNRNPSLDGKILLLNKDNGNFLALMDADWITTMRTGAVAVNSIVLFAKKGFKTLGFIGLGNTARATLLILQNVLPDRNFKIKLFKYKGQEDSFKKRFEKYNNLEFEYVQTYEDLIKGSDIIVSAVTYLEEDICSNDCFDEGVLVIPIHTRGFTNCDLFFDKVYGDDISHIHHFKNFDKFKNFSEVTDVMNGKCNGRENEKERIIVYNIGISLHDIYFAANIYKLLNNKELLELDMKQPKEKFWI